jgi:hypothetical protein
MALVKNIINTREITAPATSTKTYTEVLNFRQLPAAKAIIRASRSSIITKQSNTSMGTDFFLTDLLSSSMITTIDAMKKNDLKQKNVI